MFKLLIVDDEQIILEGIKESIDWKSYKVNEIGTAENGLKALELAKQMKPDIIITDIKMPGLNGLELVSEIKNILPYSKILIISAYEDFSYAQQAIGLGVQAYLTKPLKKKVIIDEVIKLQEIIKKERVDRENKGRLEEMYIKNLPILRQHYLNNLIKGITKHTTDYSNQFKTYEIKIEEENVGVLVCKIDNIEETSDEFFEKSIQMIHFRIMENLVYYLKSFYSHVVFQSHSNEVVAIYNMKESCMTTINNIIELSEIIRNFVLEQTGVSISFGIGRIQENISTIQASYQEAIKALNYRLLYGNNAVIFIDNVELSEYTTNYSFTSLHKQLDNLETILSMGKVSEVIKHVEKSISKLQSNKNIPYYYIQLIYSQFLSIVLKTCMEMSIPTENLLTDTTDLYGEIFKKQTLKELNNWFNDILYRTCEVINNRRAPKVSNIISSSMDYIYNNIHKEVNLNEVAKYVSLNPSYFSRLFKEQTGSSFVEYVKTLKIEKAKLLLKQGNKKIYEICDELGYQSVQYFSSLFKLEVGVTPMEYKKNS